MFAEFFALSVSEQTQVVLGWGQYLQPVPHFFVLPSKITLKHSLYRTDFIFLMI